jgi:hypothetical protein
MLRLFECLTLLHPSSYINALCSWINGVATTTSLCRASRTLCLSSPLHTSPATKKLSPRYLSIIPRDTDLKPTLPPRRPSHRWPNSAGQRTLPEHPSLWPPLGILQDHCNYILTHIPPTDPPYPFPGLIPPQSNYKRIPRATLQPLQTLKKLTCFPLPLIWNTRQPM